MLQHPNRFKLFFLIIPITVFIIGLIYIRNSGIYFLRSVDPEYGYLLNGAVLASFKANIQFITNPGIPVHFLTAIVVSIVHLFRPGLPLPDDVVVNPELYIRSVLYAINGINAISLFILGIIVFRYTRNYVASVFLQLMVLTNLLTVEATARLMPEALMPVISVCWIIAVFSWLFKRNANYSLIFGFLFSLSVTDKLTFIPYVILPLILLENWKDRLKFLLYGIGFFIILGYPLIINHHFFTDWVIGMIGHTGPYGSGEAGFAKANEFFAHLKALIRNTPFLITGLIILLSVLVIHKIKAKFPNRQILRIGTALVLLIIVQYIMASKQFAYHYMIPSILLTPLVFFTAITTLAETFSVKGSRLISLAMLAAGLWFITGTALKMKVQMPGMKKSSMDKAAVYDHISPLLDIKPLIVSPSYYGCSSVEYALIYGVHVSGKYGDFLFKTIRKYYPDFYMYFPWGKEFYEGNRGVRPSDIFKSDINYRLYMADFNAVSFNEFIDTVKSTFPGFKTETVAIDSAGTDMVFDLRISSDEP